MIKHKKGFSLLEITLVLGVGTAMAFMKFQDMKKDQENIMANTVGSQMKQMGEAVNRYISIRYDKLSTLSSSSSQSSDPGPRICSANGCEITYQTLVNEGLLPAGYNGVNMQKSSYKIVLKRSGTTPNYVINGLVITTLPWLEGNRVRYDLLGRAMQAAGIDSGMTQSATVVSGTAGQWTENQNSYSGINAAGLLAYRVGYDSSMYSVYLRRDGTLPMTGDLNMGGNDINNAKDITASGSGTFGGNLKATGTLTGSQLYTKNGYGEGLMLGGDGAGNDYELRLSSNKPLTIWSYDTAKRPSDDTRLAVWGSQVNSGDLTVRADTDGKTTGTIIAAGNITAGNWLTAHNGYGDSVRIGGDASNNDLDMHIGGGKPLNIQGQENGTSYGTVQVRGEFNISDGVGMTRKEISLQRDGNITASGNIASSGTVSGQYFQPASISVVGSICSSNGLISKDSNGKALSCVNGKWKAGDSDVAVGLYLYTSGRVNQGNPNCLYSNSSTGACSCPTGTKSVVIADSSIPSYERCTHSGSGGDGGGGNDSCSASYYSIYACMSSN
ncbi:shufflon system plasmid conjugative transfer pilus tip adhesin PilV [Pectobacterium actinidiae]|uniref:shufflon system plasmid conjugative transfer pilus tip adhesin PilV n=1 Tax=Pectobacterium actinidiae TaxID=1507808 RepID=UPI004040A502